MIETDRLSRLADDLIRANGPLQRKLQQALDCREREAVQALIEVLRFLTLIAESGEVLTPSPRVDFAWHELILFTRAYQNLCEAHFGQFIHHTPGGDEDQNRQQFHRTLKLYRERFGAPHPSFWGEESMTLPRCGGCESFPSRETS